MTEEVAGLNRGRIVWVDNARIIAMFAVVVVHVAVTTLLTTADITSRAWWIANAYDSLARWGVPVFVMISGSLLLAEHKTETLTEFYRKRTARVLIPLVFWTLFYLAWAYLKGLSKGAAPSLSSLGLSLLPGLPYYHMWFLYMILGLYFATPFIRIILRNMSEHEVRVLVAVMFVAQAINAWYLYFDKQEPLFFNRFITYLPYFIIGHLIVRAGRKPRLSLLVAIFSASVALSAVGLYILSSRAGLERGVYFYNYLSITVIPMSISAMYLLMRAGRPILGDAKRTHRLADLTLGIYLVHPVAIEVLKRLGLSVSTSNVAFMLPLTSCAVFIVSAALAWAISKTPYLRRTI